MPTQEIFRDLDILTVREEAVRFLVNGNPFLPTDVVDYTPAAIDGLSDEEMPEPEEGQRVRVQDEAGRFYGIYAYSARQKQYRVESFFYQQQ